MSGVNREHCHICAGRSLLIGLSWMAQRRCIATENARGRHLGAGVFLNYKRGDEYADIFPLWDWNAIPGLTVADGAGTTCREVTSNPSAFPPTNTSCWCNGAETHAVGETAFVGAATDGVSAAVAFEFVTPKAWFVR